ncbi:unnamed protein product, partial [Prorocentrum cordatum]
GGATARRAALMPWKIPNTSRWQWLSVRELLLRERIIFIDSFIDDNCANATLAMLLYLQSEDATKPIQIYFNVPGAMLQPSLAIYDTLKQLQAKGCKVTTVVFSLCSGMGAFLAAAGTKGRRFATPNSIFRISKTGLASPIQGQASEIELEATQMLKEAAVVEKALAEMTGKPLEAIQKDLGRDFYLDAEKAVEYGLIDKVMKSPEKRDLNAGQRDPWSGQDTRDYRHHVVEYDPERLRRSELFALVDRLVRVLFPPSVLGAPGQRPTDLELYGPTLSILFLSPLQGVQHGARGLQNGFAQRHGVQLFFPQPSDCGVNGKDVPRGNKSIINERDRTQRKDVLAAQEVLHRKLDVSSFNDNDVMKNNYPSRAFVVEQEQQHLRSDVERTQATLAVSEAAPPPLDTAALAAREEKVLRVFLQFFEGGSTQGTSAARLALGLTMSLYGAAHSQACSRKEVDRLRLDYWGLPPASPVGLQPAGHPPAAPGGQGGSGEGRARRARSRSAEAGRPPAEAAQQSADDRLISLLLGQAAARDRESQVARDDDAVRHLLRGGLTAEDPHI